MSTLQWTDWLVQAVPCLRPKMQRQAAVPATPNGISGTKWMKETMNKSSQPSTVSMLTPVSLMPWHNTTMMIIVWWHGDDYYSGFCAVHVGTAALVLSKGFQIKSIMNSKFNVIFSVVQNVMFFFLVACLIFWSVAVFLNCCLNRRLDCWALVKIYTSLNATVVEILISIT